MSWINREVKFALTSTSVLPPSGTEALIGLNVIPTETIQYLNWCKCKYWPATWSTNKENGPGGCAPLWHAHCDYYSTVIFKFDLHQMVVQKRKKLGHCIKCPSLRNVMTCETSSLPVLVKDNIQKQIPPLQFYGIMREVVRFERRKWLFISISRLLIIFLESNSKLWFHFNHFVVFCFRSCVRLIRFDRVTETYFCRAFVLDFFSFFLPSYFHKRWGKHILGAAIAGLLHHYE